MAQSTVLLAVNVSLLAIPALGGGGGGGSPSSAGNSTEGPPNPPWTDQETASIIAIYLSILFVVGALVTSMQLSDHIRGKEHSSATEAVCTFLNLRFFAVLTTCVPYMAM